MIPPIPPSEMCGVREGLGALTSIPPYVLEATCRGIDGPRYWRPSKCTKSSKAQEEPRASADIANGTHCHGRYRQERDIGPTRKTGGGSEWAMTTQVLYSTHPYITEIAMSAPLLVANGHTNVIVAAITVNGIMTLSAPDHVYQYQSSCLLAGHHSPTRSARIPAESRPKAEEPLAIAIR